MSQTSHNSSVKDSNVMSINAITSPHNRDTKFNMKRDTCLSRYRCYAPSKALIPKLSSPKELLTSPVFNNAAASHETYLSNHRSDGNHTILENKCDFLHRKYQIHSVHSSPSLTSTSTSDNTNTSVPHTPKNFSFCNDTDTTNIISAEEDLADYSYDSGSHIHGEENYFDYDGLSNTLKGDYYNKFNAKTPPKEVSLDKRRGKKVEKVIATRRANNRIASAKYRAKKQALTQALQDRIIYLATQVMSLTNELSQSKDREIQASQKYRQLRQEHYLIVHKYMLTHNNTSKIESSDGIATLSL